MNNGQAGPVESWMIRLEEERAARLAAEARVVEFENLLERAEKWISEHHEMPNYSELLLLIREALRGREGES